MNPANIRSFAREPVAPLPPAVAEIGKIHFEGNIIPHQWYQHVTLASGKPDLPAITILAEIIYWYRPYQTLTKGGKPIFRKHFHGDRFQCTAAYFVEKFGFTKDQTRKALKRLEDAGYIHREYRDIVQQGILRNCITFVEPVPPAIMAITHPDGLAKTESANDTPPSPTGDPPSPTGDPPSPTGDVYKGIEITTEISTETTTTTPNPSSSDERAAGPEAVERSGGSAQDQTQENPAINREPTMPEPNEEKPVAQEEAQTAAATVARGDASDEAMADDQRPELTYPAKLTERERDDIATQIEPLPAEVAQQMLDVVEAKIGAGQIKTSPAAVLRGITRKYRQDPASFDPSTGFRVADVRRRREEAEARLRAGAERRERVPEREPPCGVSPEAREVARRSIASMLRGLRGHA